VNINREMIKCPVLRNWPYVIFSVLTFLFFLDFFVKGYVLAGHSDRLEQMLPYNIVLQGGICVFVFPHWNPFVFCSNPMILFNSPVFYPPILLAYLGSESAFFSSVTILLLLHVFAAFVVAFLFFKKLFGSILWSVSSSVLYVLSSSSVLHMGLGLRDFQ
jgi:hypothetical protein